jgi:hypothetical protein
LETYGNFSRLEINDFWFANRKLYTPIIEEGQSQKIDLTTIFCRLKYIERETAQNKNSTPKRAVMVY